MPPKSMRSQLNQIRAWVRQGRTDAWIAHQLEVSASELRSFRRQHDLSADDDGGADEVDLRDEIEAEIEAAATDEPSDGDAEEGGEEPDGSEAEGRPRRKRRRGRRGGRGRRRRALEATLDHDEGGAELRFAVALTENPTYAEHWADQREVRVTIDPEQIVVRRAATNAGSASESDESESDESEPEAESGPEPAPEPDVESDTDSDFDSDSDSEDQ